MRSRIVLTYTVFVILIFCSCASSKKVAYFGNLRDTAFASTLDANPEPLIQKNDVLSITVSSPSPEAAAIFITPGAISPTPIIGGVAPGAGYLVDKNGNVQFPVLGNISAAGLTKLQLVDTITEKIKSGKYLIDPIVTVRFLNFRVTVLGEVARPIVVTVPNEKITILEALAQAGDLTIYGRRDNVLVIREENSKKVTKRLNLNTAEIFTSPYYYLKANDIVYAEPNSSRVSAASTTRQILPIIISALSLVVIILDRVFRNN